MRIIEPMPPSQLHDILSAVHATPHLGVILFAGAGSQALTWLHSVGGSSRTLLEATDHYAATSLVQVLGFEPERYTSLSVAEALAERAYARALDLAPDAPTFGLGCTASIATDRVKRGEHRAFVAMKDGFGVTSYALTLTKGERTRQEEEDLVSRLMLYAVAQACGLQGAPELAAQVEPHFKPARELQALMAGEAPWVMVNPDGRLRVGEGERLANIALLSGSFNPLHRGHKKLAKAAAEHLGQSVYFELPLVNADKAPIDLPEARRRAAQFAAYAPLTLTRTPLFGQKADLFPGSVFVIGADTAARLVEPRFYGGEAGMEEALEGLAAAGCRFLVAGRRQGAKGEFLNLHGIAIPHAYRELFEALPEETFRQDISSSRLRAERG